MKIHGDLHSCIIQVNNHPLKLIQLYKHYNFKILMNKVNALWWKSFNFLRKTKLNQMLH